MKQKEPTDSEAPLSAYLVGIASKGSEIPYCEEHLDELAALAESAGMQVVGRSAYIARQLDSSTFLPMGKVELLDEILSHRPPAVLIFDEEISPAQQRNLEKRWKVPVMDRTELILEIFAQRAHTREAKLQVELAKTEYEFPRLKRLWSHLSRQRASGGYLKGEGEKQIEIDRRLLKKKLQKLHAELNEVVEMREVQSHQRRRSGIPTFAIVGYTNAGKSTLMNVISGAHVLVEDRLFATLDPTTRKVVLPNHQEILLSDTVGFIRKLPHHLVAAFRSTLEVAIQDDFILHVVDVSHPLALEQAATTVNLLKELGLKNLDSVITVLNKIDCCQDRSIQFKLRLSYPRTIGVSALTGEGLPELLNLMMELMAAKKQILQLRIPQAQYALVHRLRHEGAILSEEYEENDVLIRARVSLEDLNWIKPYQYE